MMFASVWYVLSFIVGLHWGIMGVAICYAIVWTLLMVPSFLIPFRLVNLSGWIFLHTLWPSIWMAVVMMACTALWRYGLRRLGILNPFVDLLTTVFVGVVVYVVLVLWRKPPVVSELANVLRGTSYRAAQWLGRNLPQPSAKFSQLDEFKSVTPSRH
jgi:PST family polysaccharide transporter